MPDRVFEPLDALTARLKPIPSKMEQAARIAGKLRERKQAALAAATRFSLSDILARERRLLDICEEGIQAAEALFGHINGIAKRICNPDSALAWRLGVFQRQLFLARNYLNAWEEEWRLWMRWEAADDRTRAQLKQELSAKERKLRAIQESFSFAEMDVEDFREFQERWGGALLTVAFAGLGVATMDAPRFGLALAAVATVLIAFTNVVKLLRRL